MTSASAITLALLVGAAAWSVWDVAKSAQETIVVYTAPALRDLLERDIIPAFEEASGYRVAPVYVAAGQQFNRLRMSGDSPEADLVLHASPLYLEKGYAEGLIDPLPESENVTLEGAYQSREVDGRRIWRAFAWSPLVAVYPEGAPSPDLAHTDATFGFPHPLLSNNGVYAVLYLENVGSDAGARLVGQTRVQPTNARANIGGVADGSFDLTLGYEAGARFYQAQGADIGYDFPRMDGERSTMRVVFSAGLVRDAERHHGADDFVAFLFTQDAQAMLWKHHFRSVFADAPATPGALPLDVSVHETDWSRWEDIEAVLPKYEVRS